jgi:imidazolonepropionase-like amidohydrolase
VNLQDQIGAIAPGAVADIIGVAGDPFEDLNVLADPARFLKLVIRGGEIVMNRMTPS